jgi:hypothetical protein
MEKELGEKISLDEVKKKIMKHFEAIFNCELVVDEKAGLKIPG